MRERSGDIKIGFIYLYLSYYLVASLIASEHQDGDKAIPSPPPKKKEAYRSFRNVRVCGVFVVPCTNVHMNSIDRCLQVGALFIFTFKQFKNNHINN